MKKLINDAGRVVHEALTGVARVTEGAAVVHGHHVLVRADRDPGRVAVLSGGGPGHEPAFSGYLGPGHLEGAISGEVFASPRRGRSSYLGERAHGRRDAGADAVVVVLRALAEA